VVKLFNVIQQSQLSAAAAEEEAKINRGTGKPSLPAPSTIGKGKNKGKNKDNILGRAKESEYFRGLSSLEPDHLMVSLSQVSSTRTISSICSNLAAWFQKLDPSCTLRADENNYPLVWSQLSLREVTLASYYHGQLPC